MLTALRAIFMLPAERLRRLATLALLLGGSCALGAAAATGQAVVIERSDPRLFGYQLGDVIPEQVTIDLAPGYQLDAQSLPRAGKRAGWFLVRGTELQTYQRPDGGTRLQLRLELQLTNSPANARSLTIPPVALRFKGPQTLEDTIPSLTIDAVPLGTGEVRTGLPDVRPPRPAPLIDTGRVEQQLRGVTLAAALVAAWLLLVLAWQRLRPGRSTPFAAAQRDLRRLLRNATSLAGARAAVQRVHRAFDEAAGQRLFGAGVAGFCQRMGVDATLEKRTESFFSVSQTLFFAVPGGGDATPAAVPDDLARDLAELCRAWRKFEGRHP